MSPAAQKEEGYDWSKWGWGADGKEKDEPPVKSENGSSAVASSDEWGDWSHNNDDTSSAKPRRVGKKD